MRLGFYHHDGNAKPQVRIVLYFLFECAGVFLLSARRAQTLSVDRVDNTPALWFFSWCYQGMFRRLRLSDEGVNSKSVSVTELPNQGVLRVMRCLRTKYEVMSNIQLLPR